MSQLPGSCARGMPWICRGSCCKGLRRSPEAWQTLLSLPPTFPKTLGAGFAGPVHPEQPTNPNADRFGVSQPLVRRTAPRPLPILTRSGKQTVSKLMLELTRRPLGDPLDVIGFALTLMARNILEHPQGAPAANLPSLARRNCPRST